MSEGPQEMSDLRNDPNQSSERMTQPTQGENSVDTLHSEEPRSDENNPFTNQESYRLSEKNREEQENISKIDKFAEERKLETINPDKNQDIKTQKAEDLTEADVD